MNIYAPNNVNERKDFYKYIINYLSNTDNNTYILGYFNCTISTQNDRYPSNNSEDGANYELTNLISTHDMFDVWRKRNPDKNQYTFKRGNSQSLIDMILAPNNKDCDISNAYPFRVCSVKKGYKKPASYSRDDLESDGHSVKIMI